MINILNNKNWGVFFLVVMLIAGCKESKNNKPGYDTGDANVEELYKGYYQNPSNLDEEQQNMIIDYAIENNLNLLRLESGLYIMLIQEGIGPKLRWGEKVRVEYIGTYLDGREFDSTYRRGKSFVTSVGAAIPGWNEALRKLQSGAKAKIILPSRLGYGDKEYAGIPPNSILVFDLHVVI